MKNTIVTIFWIIAFLIMSVALSICMIFTGPIDMGDDEQDDMMVNDINKLSNGGYNIR